ncbi:hypothetical protein DASC09_021470 [Saccharomycopsis crataegensis]|uniref:MADF domain-containing protein n=1 Tax=Saccharomycopsis crataegensis TaxID=43959 RepID=A0AAV5QJT4_9ASCO|nr:hypothetical protein DASC09_021470 [Saccharomycopsis crataegensis]
MIEQTGTHRFIIDFPDSPIGVRHIPRSPLEDTKGLEFYSELLLLDIIYCYAPHFSLTRAVKKHHTYNWDTALEIWNLSTTTQKFKTIAPLKRRWRVMQEEFEPHLQDVGVPEVMHPYSLKMYKRIKAKYAENGHPISDLDEEPVIEQTTKKRRKSTDNGLHEEPMVKQKTKKRGKPTEELIADNLPKMTLPNTRVRALSSSTFDSFIDGLDIPPRPRVVGVPLIDNVADTSQDTPWQDFCNKTNDTIKLFMQRLKEHESGIQTVQKCACLLGDATLQIGERLENLEKQHKSFMETLNKHMKEVTESMDELRKEITVIRNQKTD